MRDAANPAVVRLVSGRRHAACRLQFVESVLEDAIWTEDAALGVGPLTAVTVRRAVDARDAIEVLIPDGSAVVSAVYRAPGGVERTAFVRAPMIAIIPPGADCELHCGSPGETLVLQIDAVFFAEQVRAALGESAPERLVARYAALDPFIREIGRMLRSELSRDRRPNDAWLKPLAGVMAVHLAHHYSASPPFVDAPGGLAPYKLRRVELYIREHLAEPLVVAQLAAQVRMSPFHFARMFRRTTGQTPHRYVVIQRVETAKQLLQASDAPLIDVAARVGFRTLGHFTGVFHRYADCTPRAYRMECRARGDLPGG